MKKGMGRSLVPRRALVVRGVSRTSRGSECILMRHLLPTGSEERGVLGFGSIPVVILPSCQSMKMLHHNCIDMNIVG